MKCVWSFIWMRKLLIANRLGLLQSYLFCKTGLIWENELGAVGGYVIQGSGVPVSAEGKQINTPRLHQEAVSQSQTGYNQLNLSAQASSAWKYQPWSLAVLRVGEFDAARGE